QAFADRTISPGTVLSRPVWRPPIFIGVFGRQIAYIRAAFLYELDRICIELVEVIGRVERFKSGWRWGRTSSRWQRKILLAMHDLRFRRFALGLKSKPVLGPSTDQPADILETRIHVLDFFFS